MQKRAVVISVVGGALAGGGKFLSNNAIIMNKFDKNSNTVKSLGEQSLKLGLSGRGTYTEYWMNASLMQTIYKIGVSVGLNLLRGGSRTLINFLW